MSNTRRMTVNVPVELYERCSAAIDGVYLLNMSQLVLVAMSDLVAQKQSPPLPSSPLHPPTPNTPPIISPKGDIYTPPNSPPQKESKPRGHRRSTAKTSRLSGMCILGRLRQDGMHGRRTSHRRRLPSRHPRRAGGQHQGEGLGQPEMKFIPHASTWLNGRRWEDTFDAKPAKRKASQPQEYVPPVDYRPALDGESCE